MNPYAIYKQHSVNRDGKLFWFWNVRLVRQGKVVLRRFSFLTYGGEQTCFLIAQAYRDAILRLFPPKTALQRFAALGQENPDEIVGVKRCIKPNKTILWQAKLSSVDENGQKKVFFKSFSVGRYGEEGAKALAIAKRQEFLAQCQNRFITRTAYVEDLANQFFPGLPEQQAREENLAPTIDMEEMNRKLKILDAWFDAQRPLRIKVTANWRLHPLAIGSYLEVRVSDGGFPARRKDICFRISPKRGEKDVLKAAWIYVHGSLIVMYGEAEWLKFADKYQKAFFDITVDRGFKVRDWYIPPDEALRRKPPEALAPQLPDFEIPSIYAQLGNAEHGEDGVQAADMKDSTDIFSQPASGEKVATTSPARKRQTRRAAPTSPSGRYQMP